MELDRAERTILDRGDERASVLRPRDHRRFHEGLHDVEVPALHGIRVDEIETFIFNAAEELCVFRWGDTVSTHMRYDVSFEAFNNTWPFVQARGCGAAFGAFGEQHLVAYADPEDWFSACDPVSEVA